MTWGQVLHLGGNVLPALALMDHERSAEDQNGSTGQFRVRDCEKMRVWFPVTWSNLGNERQSPHMDGHRNCGAVVSLRRPAGFPLLGYPAQPGVFPNPPPSLSSEFPHSFCYFKIVTRLCSFLLAPNLTVFPICSRQRLASFQHSCETFRI